MSNDGITFAGKGKYDFTDIFSQTEKPQTFCHDVGNVEFHCLDCNELFYCNIAIIKRNMRCFHAQTTKLTKEVDELLENSQGNTIELNLLKEQLEEKKEL